MVTCTGTANATALVWSVPRVEFGMSCHGSSSERAGRMPGRDKIFARSEWSVELRSEATRSRLACLEIYRTESDGPALDRLLPTALSSRYLQCTGPTRLSAGKPMNAVVTDIFRRSYLTRSTPLHGVRYDEEHGTLRRPMPHPSFYEHLVARDTCRGGWTQATRPPPVESIFRPLPSPPLPLSPAFWCLLYCLRGPTGSRLSPQVLGVPKVEDRRHDDETALGTPLGMRARRALSTHKPRPPRASRRWSVASRPGKT